MGKWAAGRVAIVFLALLVIGQVCAQRLRVAGSSTLYPASAMFAAEVEERLPGAAFEVSFAGTAGGFDLLCKGAAAIIGASRLATSEEQEECAANGVEFVAFPVALDAVVLVVSEENDWLRCLTLEEVRRLWSGGPDRVDSWSELRSDWPDRQIEFLAPGVASGTYDYWNQRVLGEDAAMRTDFFPSEDDRQLAQSAAGNPNALTFFSRAQLLLAGSRLRAIALDDGFGCVDPASLEQSEAGPWPLVRPLFLYVSASATSSTAESRRAVVELVELFLSHEGQEMLRSAGYLPLDQRLRREALARFRDQVVGPLPADYGGQSILRQLPGGWTRRQGDLRGRLLALEGEVQTVGVVHSRFDTLLDRLLDSRGRGGDDTR